MDDPLDFSCQPLIKLSRIAASKCLQHRPKMEFGKSSDRIHTGTGRILDETYDKTLDEACNPASKVRDVVFVCQDEDVESAFMP